MNGQLIEHLGIHKKRPFSNLAFEYRFDRVRRSFSGDLMRFGFALRRVVEDADGGPKAVGKTKTVATQCMPHPPQSARSKVYKIVQEARMIYPTNQDATALRVHIITG